MYYCCSIWLNQWEGEFVVENVNDSCIMQSKPRLSLYSCVCVCGKTELGEVKRKARTLGLTNKHVLISDSQVIG